MTKLSSSWRVLNNIDGLRETIISGHNARPLHDRSENSKTISRVFVKTKRKLKANHKGKTNSGTGEREVYFALDEDVFSTALINTTKAGTEYVHY